MAKFKETCKLCKYSFLRGVGDSFDRACDWLCTHPIFSEPKIIDAYRDEKDGSRKFLSGAPCRI